MHGAGGTLWFGTIQIGTLGRWRLGGGEGQPSFSASSCDIAAFWTSAGVARLCARPHADGKPKLWAVEGDVHVLAEDSITLINITVTQEGAAT